MRLFNIRDWVPRTYPPDADTVPDMITHVGICSFYFNAAGKTRPAERVSAALLVRWHDGDGIVYNHVPDAICLMIDRISPMEFFTRFLMGATHYDTWNERNLEKITPSEIDHKVTEYRRRYR